MFLLQQNFNIRTWWTEILQFDWLIVVLKNSIDHAVEIHVLKTMDNDLNRSLLRF